MKTSLHRLLRVRALLEEAAKTTLQSQAAVVQRVEKSLRQEAEAEQRLHVESLRHLLQPAVSAGFQSMAERPEDAEMRHLAEEARDAGRPGRELLARIAGRETARMLERGEEFLVRRKERRQIEILLDLAAGHDRVKTMRRAQRDLDDWYAVSRRRQPVDSKKP